MLIRRWVLMAALLAVAACAGRLAAGEKGKGKAKEGMLVHCVFFTLKERTPEARKKLVDACKKYLTKHPGEVFFSAGPRTEDLEREVNDRDFDVALVIVFKDRASHDRYQDAKRHKQFIVENQPTWKKVRVFDSSDQAAARSRPSR
jgi:hypothetical protein